MSSKPEPLSGIEHIEGRPRERKVYCCFVTPDGPCGRAIDPRVVNHAREIVGTDETVRTIPYRRLRLLCPEHIAQARNFWLASMR